MKHKILFLIGAFSHVLRTAPVIEQLQKDEDFDVVVIFMWDKRAQVEMERRGIKYKNLDYYWREDNLKNYGKKLGRILAESKECLTKEINENLSWNSILLVATEYKAMYNIEKAMRHFSLAEEIIKEEKPSLIVIISELSTWARSITMITKRKGIPSLLIQEGLYGEKGGWIYVKNVDVVASWGEAFKQSLLRRGIEPERIVITGNPEYDQLADSLERNKKEIKEKIRRKLCLNDTVKIVLHTPTPESIGLTKQEQDFMEKKLVETISELENVCLIFKIHPKWEEFTEMQNFILKNDKYQKVVRIVDDISTHELLFLSDLLIAEHTTVAIDAMVLKKPVIMCNFTRREDVVDYAKMGGALGIYDPRDLKGAIHKILTDKAERDRLIRKSQEYLVYQAGKLDGLATERVIDLIKKMVRY
jgi:UDP-N-acetylglucosamine 2-epimerase